MPTRNPTPKNRFLTSKQNLENHNRIFDTNEARTSLDVAMMEYLAQITLHTPEQVAGAGHLKMKGAQEFVHILLHLSESAPSPQRIDTHDNLIHTTGN